jgi:N-alpha-acetyl-L-2,4-diaminobutyrate deacetylase
MHDEHTPISTDIDFEKDGKQVSYLKVPHSRNDSAWGSVLIPITVIKNGVGPTVLLVGGVHGGEYEGPVALMKLHPELDLGMQEGLEVRLARCVELDSSCVRHERHEG